VKCPKCEEETNAHYMEKHGMCINGIYDSKPRGKK